MSKAFTRESDDPRDEPIVMRTAVLPPGAKNYLTAKGARELRDKLSRLTDERTRHAQSENDNEKSILTSLDQRILNLQESLATAEVVSPPDEPADRVAFGATVTVRERSGEELAYRIVGADEVDLDRGWVSWLSPIAKALLNARPGELVCFKPPSGERVLKITSIKYE